MKRCADFPFDLEDLISQIEGSDRTMVLGGIDTGKTTLTRAIHDRLGGLVLDGDLGQPEIGPPGLISLGSHGNGMEDAYFVGSFTPRGNLVQVISGIASLLSLDQEKLLIDTDGWIEGDAARIYKGELINLVKPDTLILLQRAEELEKLATYLAGGKVINLPAQERREKTRGERAANRIRNFKYYFSQARRVEKSWDQLTFAGTLIGKGKVVKRAGLNDYFDREILKAWKYRESLTIISRGSSGSRSGLAEKHDVTDVDVYSTEDLKYRLLGCYRVKEFVGEGTITQLSPDGIGVLAPEREFDLVKFGKERVKPSGRSLQ